MKLDEIFDRLWTDYTTQNPSAKKVFDLFKQEGEDVKNDHIAFRTFNDPRIDIEVLSKSFKDNGYVEKGDYEFPVKHLLAKHFEHPDLEDAPRVFISQLVLEDFSTGLQEIIRHKIDSISKEQLIADDLIFSGNVWGLPSYEIYNKLRLESEYAAWLYVYGFRANHFTVSINALRKYDSIEKVNQFLKDNGFKMNDSGGEIKGTPGELLEQSSIMADYIDVECTEGIRSIPGCYYEFARRYPDAGGNLYSGFIAKSADKIFESTNYHK